MSQSVMLIIGMLFIVAIIFVILRKYSKTHGLTPEPEEEGDFSEDELAAIAMATAESAEREKAEIEASDEIEFEEVVPAELAFPVAEMEALLLEKFAPKEAITFDSGSEEEGMRLRLVQIYDELRPLESWVLTEKLVAQAVSWHTDRMYTDGRKEKRSGHAMVWIMNTGIFHGEHIYWPETGEEDENPAPDALLWNGKSLESLKASADQKATLQTIADIKVKGMLGFELKDQILFVLSDYPSSKEGAEQQLADIYTYSQNFVEKEIL